MRKIQRNVICSNKGCYKFLMGYNPETNVKCWLTLPYWTSYDIVDNDGTERIAWSFNPLTITNICYCSLFDLLDKSPYGRFQMKAINKLAQELIEQGENYKLETYYELVGELLGSSVMSDIARMAEFQQKKGGNY